MAELEKAILVEGTSDALAVSEFARRRGRDLEAEGVAVLTLGGGGGLAVRLAELGPHGRNVALLGLCDADHERRWARWLEAAGLGSHPDRDSMECAGFFVCDPDLEGELIRALGVPEVLRLLAADGEAYAYETFLQQPAQQSTRKTDVDLLRRFHGAQSRRKTKYPRLLVEAGSEPRPLVELVARI
jgi:hypothetical protein